MTVLKQVQEKTLLLHGLSRGRLRGTLRVISRGFTLIELMVVLVVIAVLAGIIAPRYMDRVEDAREVVLRQSLFGLRTAIDQFYRDKARYPSELNELVTQRYIRAVPIDPVTQRLDTWVEVPLNTSERSVFDVKSGATGKAKDGSAYASW